MDAVNNWKRILLQWIKQCNFLEKPFYSIEQSEIEAFFIKFKEQIKSDIFKSKDLSSFIKEHYPLFEPNFDDENALSSSDYVYVYSLLLHFSCVKCPDEFFQKNCQLLNDLAQQNITTFFKQLLEANSLTKETLRHAIASVSSFAPPNMRLICMESPMKTPRRTEISPPTPSSFVLQERQERNKELHCLKAQLDNEVYEKGILEIEVKQHQEKILKLSQELKKAHQSIQDLKNDIFSRSNESDSVDRHSDEQLNRRLSKQISQKEMEITKQQQDIDALTEQKDIFREKLSHAEKQMNMFQSKIGEVTLKVDELTAELEQKDITIQCLLDAKFELEHYISEVRSSSASSRPDLNISVECLDMSRTTNSSGSVNSPENLGCSVVDIQLREKEIENAQLRDNIAAIRLDNSKLSKHMSDLTVRYSKFFDICNENLIIDQQNIDPVENFMVFSNYVEKFVNKFEKNCVAFNDLKENTKALEEQNNILSNKLAEMESEVVCLKKKIYDLQGSTKTLETSNTSLESVVSEYKSKLEISLKERLEAVQNFENVQRELEHLRTLKADTDHSFVQKIEHFKRNLDNKQDQFAKLEIDFENKDKTLKSLESEMITIKMQNQKLISQIKQITKDYEHEKANTKIQYESDIRLLNEKLEESSAALLENEKRFQELETEKQVYENRIHDLKSEYGNIEKELLDKIAVEECQLVEKSNIINELENNKKILITKLDESKQTCDYVLGEKNRCLTDAQKYKEEISYLKNTLKENEQALSKLTCDQNRRQLIISELQTEKDAFINSIQERIDTFRTAIDQHEHYFKEKIHELSKQNTEVTKKLAYIGGKLELRQREFDDISSKYNSSREALAKQTEHSFGVIDEFKTRLQLITDKINSDTTAYDFQEKGLLFPLSLDSADAVNNLKQYLNMIIQKLQQVTLLKVENEEHVAKLKQERSNLETKLILSEKRMLELREDLENESQCEQNKLTNEVKRLNDDIINLESVCDRLTEENVTLQSKLSELQMITEQLTQKNSVLKAKISVLDADRSSQLSMVDKLIKTETELRNEVFNMQSSAKKLEVDIEAAQQLVLAKTRDAELLQEKHNEAEFTIDSMKRKISELETEVLILKGDLKRTNEKHEAASKIVEQNSREQHRKLEILEDRLDTETREKWCYKKELDIEIENSSKLDNERIVLENKNRYAEKQLEKLKNELGLTKTELIRLQCEETRLLGEIEIIKETKFASEVQVEKCNIELVEQKENVSRLIKEIASIRREKEAAEEEKTLLLKRFEEKETTRASVDSNHKSIVEKLQLAEKDLLAKHNLVKSEQLKSQDLDNQLKKLQIEYMKLKETAENNIKRMEKQALKLGETQAKAMRLKKEADQAQNNLETLKSATEITQRENSKLNSECKFLKEKLLNSEKAYDQLESKSQILEKSNEVLRKEKENIDTSENELKSSNAILEKNKSNLEDKVRKLAKSLSDTNVAISRLEQDKVQLNLEVGGLNTQLQESKSLLSIKLKEFQDVTTNLIEAKNANLTLMELNEKLQLDANEIREENSRLNDELSKLSLRLQITQKEHESIKTELEDLRSDMEIKKAERDTLEMEYLASIKRFKEIEVLAEERHATESELMDKIKLLETEHAKVSSEYRNLEEMRKQEKQTNEKLNTDISILQAKLQKSRSICEENEKNWSEEKEQLLTEVKASDERIKETRLELEGKLEKMKNKMKTLYNDEITKMKKKQEREVAITKTELDALKAQNEKYEEHTKKLSSQIFRLNENILEHQKQNTFLKTKLKDLENKPRQFGRITTSHAPQSLSSNLHMEDEEGEVFNNTYLSDLKNGRMSELFSRDICPQELQYRNSLLPPHLKSTYLAQFDHQMGEDEIRETANLDDSSSTLLNTGQRKKVSGATSYKRPGPPTPSKNAGRLSFGGNGELNREILKETLEMGNGPSSSKTPAKFKLFSSRLSMKDERKNYVTAFKRKQHLLGTIQCSSTPRKSKAHFDQRRLLDQIMSTASSGPDDSVQSLVSPANNFPPTLKTVELCRRMSQKWSQPKPSCAAPDSETSDVNSPLCKETRYESGGKRSKRLKDRRGSMYLRGTMFARNCRTPNIGFREVFKKKSKMQRNATFNKYRSEMLNEFLVKKASVCVPGARGINNNYFVEAMNINKNSIEGLEGTEFHFHNSGASDNNEKSSNHFQQLLIEKASQAPFEISEINGPSYLNGNSSSTVHSRIIYGTSVILNRKIPHVNTTLVRKSSIYVKANDGHGIILVTNQTITLMDLAQMWIQMNMSAKVVIGLSFTTLCVAMVSVVIKLLFQ